MKNHKLAGRNIIYVFISLVLSLAVYWGINSVLAAANPNIVPIINPIVNTLNSTTTDAIAVRIVANPAQYTIDEWYAKQGFTGSPQKIKVDGYDAIRDNRTVYVAATNIKGTCDLPSINNDQGEIILDQGGQINLNPLKINAAEAAIFNIGSSCSVNSDCNTGNCSLSKIYFNIYIITYNQGASAPTSDVFGKILSSWKFNNNLSAQLGSCSFPPKNCQTESDCGAAADYTCSNFRCVSKRKCLSDADCNNGALCNSVKSGLQRDVRRLQALNKINQSLKSYKNVHGKYPMLASGTFLPQVVISTWPSWQSVFIPQIGAGGANDPINKIGVCNTLANATTTMAGFDAEACWNANTKKYYNASNSLNLELPNGSYAMAYTTDTNGSNYKLCANMETSFSFMSVDNVQVNLSAANCQTTAPVGYTGSSNNPPAIVAMNLNGVSGQEYNGYIKAEDPEGNPMTFSIVSSLDSSWTNWTGNQAPILKSTSDPKQKKIWSAKAGDAGNYAISLQVTDSNGASVTTSTVIKIAAGAAVIVAPDVEYDLSSDPNNILNYSLYFDDLNFDYLDLSFNVSLSAIFRNWFNNLSALFVTPALAIGKDVGGLIIAPANPGGLVIDPIGIGIGIGGGTRPPLVGCSNITQSGGAWRINKAMTNCFNLNNGLKGKLYKEADGRYRLNIYGNFDSSIGGDNANLTYKVKVHNTLNRTSEKSFTIKLKSNPPQIDFSCNKKADIYKDYACQINNLNTKNKTTTYRFNFVDLNATSTLQNDVPSDHFIVNLPSGFTGNPSTGLISGMPTNVGNYRFEIEAENEYGAKASKNYNLTVETSCGKTLVPYSGGPWDARGEVKNQGGYYKTTLIGSQCWLADNLNISRAAVFNNQTYEEPVGGSNLLNRIKETPWWKRALSFLFQPYSVLAQVMMSGSYTNIGICYNNDNTYCEADGRLYKATEFMAGAIAPSTRGICPTGYHLPSKEEYNELVTNLGSNQGNKLKQNGDSGFEGLLAGSAYIATGSTTLTFADRNSFGSFWTSSVENAKNWYRRLSSADATVGQGLEADASRYYSLRCLQDKLCPANCNLCNNLGECCTISSWTPSDTAPLCGNLVQTSNCGTARMATGATSCHSPQTCGGGGTPNVCGCIPSCVGKCGGASNGCGAACPNPCQTGQTCSAGVCTTPFACGTETVTYGGQVYNSVQIGNQCWLKQNLNIGTMVNGNANQGNFSDGIQKYCQDDNAAICAIYGGLYQWHMATGRDASCIFFDCSSGPNNACCIASAQGICPAGWRVPSSADWAALETNQGGSVAAAAKLKATSPAWDGTNSSGFTGLAAGSLSAYNWTFNAPGSNSNFWSSDPWNQHGDGTYPDDAYLFYLGAGTGVNYYSRDMGFSVRCMRDIIGGGTGTGGGSMPDIGSGI